MIISFEQHEDTKQESLEDKGSAKKVKARLETRKMSKESAFFRKPSLIVNNEEAQDDQQVPQNY